MKSVVWGYKWVKKHVSEMPFVRRRALLVKIAEKASNEKYHRRRMEEFRAEKNELIREYDALKRVSTEAWLKGRGE